RQAIVLGAPVVVRNAPFRRKQPAQLQPVERGVERAFFHTEHFLGALLDELRDSIAVHRTPLQSLENQHVEFVAKQFAWSGLFLFHNVLMGKKESAPGELLRDKLDMLILKTLQRGPMHGYGIAEFIEQRSEEVLRVEEGALYPALHRLELRGLLSAEWGISDNNRRAKYYRLT